MFPEGSNTNSNDAVLITSNRTYNIISKGSNICKTPNFNFETKEIPLKNGDVDLVSDYQNVRNWIVKFLLTPIDVYKIYEGTSFGTSIYKIKGYKNIDGMLYAQIKKEIEDGFKMNPNIKNVLSVVLSKEKDILNIYVKVQLADGYILEEKTETYNLEG